MLAGSVALLAMVSAFVAFGSWPGANSAKQIDQVVLRDVVTKTKPEKIAVRSDAVVVARRVQARRQAVAVQRATRTGSPRVTHTKPGSRTLPAGNTVAQAPKTGTGPAGATAPVTHGVQQGVQQTTQQIQNTTQQVQQGLQQTTQQVQQGVQQTTQQVQQGVQQTTQQVGEVVDQVIGGAQTTTQNAVNQVNGTVNGLLGH